MSFPAHINTYFKVVSQNLESKNYCQWEVVKFRDSLACEDIKGLQRARRISRSQCLLSSDSSFGCADFLLCRPYLPYHSTKFFFFFFLLLFLFFLSCTN